MTEALVALYRLALRGPPARVGAVAETRDWLARRAELMATLLGTPSAVDRALLALIIHADAVNGRHLVQQQRHLDQQLRRFSEPRAALGRRIHVYG